MIQIWNDSGREEDKVVKYAYFANGTARFATVASFASADMVRLALLDSNDVRTDIQPDPGRPILWHEGDRPTIAAYFNRRVDAVQDAFLLSVVDSNRGRITTYQLKQIEMLAIELGVDGAVGTPILDAESGGDSDDRADLLSKWQVRSTAWLSVVGASERALRLAKEAIAEAADDNEMAAIVSEFPDTLRKIINE